MLLRDFLSDTAIAGDTGLSGSEFEIVFSPTNGDQTQCSDITITDDLELEGDHSFTVTITGAGSMPHARITTPSVTTVNIEDDESE